MTDKLTAGEGDKKTFNGVVLEPLVLLVEVGKETLEIWLCFRVSYVNC